ncbi:MAG: hypothetical protein C5B50_09605 [Verrucomicrobia bacterium]|nr:MAG: hypothetical protein C5B50_09605 [Verrucomicrobiota bacterium]
MSLDWPVRSIFSNVTFWKCYFWQEGYKLPPDGFLELVNHEEPVSPHQAAYLRQHNATRTKWRYCRLELPLEKHWLRLQFDPQCESINLSLGARSGKCIELGWDDQAHWHPHVLRCEELDLFCRCIAVKDPGLPHPGVSLLLFSRFAPVTDSEDSHRALSVLSEAWKSLKLFDDEEIADFLKMVDFRSTGVEWQRDQQLNWTLHLDRDLHPGTGLYTLRCAENPEFPFEQLRTALNEAAQIAGAQS